MTMTYTQLYTYIHRCFNNNNNNKINKYNLKSHCIIYIKKKKIKKKIKKKKKKKKKKKIHSLLRKLMSNITQGLRGL